MNLKIKTQTENKLLSRKELKGHIDFSGATPSNDEVAKKIADNLKSDLDLVVLKGIYTQFGKTHATFEALVYDNKESKDQIEPVTKHQKEKIKKAAEEAKKAAEESAKKKEEEKKAADKPEEKSKEEKKAPEEAKPAESKPEEDKK